jgi:signal transduction histidine kinase
MRTMGLLSLDRTAVFASLVVVAVLVPALCVLWLTQEVIATHSAAAGQQVLAAYRDQLRILRRRLDQEWQRRATELNGRTASTGIERLAATVGADALVLLDLAGPRPFPATDSLAATYLQTQTPAPGLIGLQRTRRADVWQLSAPDGRTIALFRDETVHMDVHRLIDEHQSPAVRFAVFKPDEAAYDDALTIGPAMPGWQASFTVLDTGVIESAARARTRVHVWSAALGIGLFTLLGAALAYGYRRQVRLARLQTDTVAAISHELRTPLASMRLLVDGLLRDRELDSTKTREYLQLMSAENSRLSRVVDNVLAFSRLERGRQTLAFSETRPADVVQAAVAAMRERAADGCDIRVDVAPDLPPLQADADALVTALLNLLDNAYKYTPRDKRIGITASSQNGCVLLAVEDNGIGIPARERARIFRRFYRVDRRLSRDTTGVGLGLSIVRDIVTAHGGRVDVVSEPGSGSSFVMRLPYSRGGHA